MKNKFKIGIIGLSTMGANLARNFSDKKIFTITFNRTYEKTEKLIKNFGNKYLTGSKTLKEFLEKLEKPRKIILLVKAGTAVDEVLEELTPLLTKGDILIDCGNSHFQDTKRRQSELTSRNLCFLGCGISGGEEGALNGPSLMPGGDKSAWLKIRNLFEKIAAKDFQNKPCATYIGPTGSGHFVKMVHNGIEYGIMQLIAESYDILKTLGNLNNKELGQTFENFQKTSNLKSFLLEITSRIFTKKEGKRYLIDLIKDSAGQKGTGKWTTFAAMDLGLAIPTITAAVDARIISGDKKRSQTYKFLKQNIIKHKITKKNLIRLVSDSLELATMFTYAQGFELIKKASSEYDWNLNFSEIARIWQGGCIIRSNYLKKLQIALGKNQQKAREIKQYLIKLFAGKKQKNWRRLINLAIENGIPVPSFYAALSYYDSYSKDKLPQNLIQAQRDLFGAHGYKRIDKKGQFHINWHS